MIISFWSYFGILAFGAFLALVANRFINYIKLLNTCTTCGSQHNDKATLTQCPVCQKWFCSDNLEIIDEADMINQKIVDVIPSNLISEYPCGTKYIHMGIPTEILCKKDSRRPICVTEGRLDK